MPSKGSPRVTIRIKPEMYDRIISEIEQVNLRTRSAPYDLSAFIIKALADKLAHLARSRKSGKKPKHTPSPPPISPLESTA
jgi:hypothetical protein